jgi:cobyrinic acid a,c-diamide synthase
VEVQQSIKRPQPLLIAAPASGCGKTTVTLGLLAALRRRGLRVAPFKVGPDYIDPGLHRLAAGVISHNLDGWMCGEQEVRTLFNRAAAGADVALIEGVMGLFDGASGSCDVGSSAEIAGWLNGKVLLVVDARSQARSVAALISGFCNFNPDLEWAGVILNRVGSSRHEQLLLEACASVPGLPPVLGCLPRSEEISLPERHLGLMTAEEGHLDADLLERLADWLERYVDIETLLASLDAKSSPVVQPVVVAPDKRTAVRIGIARDAAFCFYYQDNLDRLVAAGAELIPFSPLADTTLPADLDGLLLGGGYPELYAGELEANRSLRNELRELVEAGLPVYAECGGLLYLCASLDGAEMTGLFPAEARLEKKRRALGYREITLTKASLLGPAGTVLRGHEFHYSDLQMPDEIERLYRVRRADGNEQPDEGFVYKNCLGSYIHLHFASCPAVAARLVAACRKLRQNI